MTRATRDRSRFGSGPARPALRVVGLLAVLASVAPPGGSAAANDGAPRVKREGARRSPVRTRRWWEHRQAIERAATRSPGAFRQVPHSSYRELAGVAREILSRFPPERYFYLGVGRSPSGVVEILHALLPGGAQGFPAGGLSDRAGHDLSDAHYANFREHFERFVPDPQELAGRTVLLMDVAQSGGTLIKVARLLQRYLEEKGADTKVETLGLAGNATKSIDHRLRDGYVVTAVGTEQIARFEHHPIRERKVSDLKPRTARARFVRGLLRRLAEDEGMRRFVQDGFPRWLRLGTTEQEKLWDGEPAALSKEQAAAELRRVFESLGEAARLDTEGKDASIWLTAELVPNARRRLLVQSNLPAELLDQLQEKLAPLLARLTFNHEAVDNPLGIRIRGQVPADGEWVRARDMSIEPFVPEVPRLPSEVMGKLADLTPAAGPAGDAREAELQTAIASLMTGPRFPAASKAAASKVELRVEPNARYGELQRLMAHSNLPIEWWRSRLEPHLELIERYTADARGGRGRHGFKATLALDADGRLEGPDAVHLERVPAVVPVRRGMAEDTLELGRKARGRAGEARRDELRDALAANLASVAFVNGRREPAKSFRVELEPTDPGSGSTRYKVRSEVPPALVRELLRDYEPLLERYTFNPRTPGNRSAVEIDVELGPDGVLRDREAVSVQRVPGTLHVGDPRRTTLASSEDRGRARHARSESDLRRELATRLSNLRFLKSGQKAKVLELGIERFSEGSSDATYEVESGLPNPVVEAALTPLLPLIHREVENAAAPHNPRAMRIRLELDSGIVQSPESISLETSVPVQRLAYQPSEAPMELPPARGAVAEPTQLRKQLFYAVRDLRFAPSSGRAKSVQVRVRPKTDGTFGVHSKLTRRFWNARRDTFSRALSDYLHYEDQPANPFEANIEIRLSDDGTVAGPEAIDVQRVPGSVRVDGGLGRAQAVELAPAKGRASSKAELRDALARLLANVRFTRFDGRSGRLELELQPSEDAGSVVVRSNIDAAWWEPRLAPILPVLERYRRRHRGKDGALTISVELAADGRVTGPDAISL